MVVDDVDVEGVLVEPDDVEAVVAGDVGVEDALGENDNVQDAVVHDVDEKMWPSTIVM